MRMRWAFADGLVRAGKLDEALVVTDGTLEMARSNDQLFMVPELLRTKAEILGKRDNGALRSVADT